jgi:hypothetical protein
VGEGAIGRGGNKCIWAWSAWGARAPRQRGARRPRREPEIVIVILMGVSGCGKTKVGALLAEV